jgi:hypothetical protein
MVLREWIVPEPDPNLSLRVSDIDIYTLNYEDIRYICSSGMKKYYNEFLSLEGFKGVANELIRKHQLNIKAQQSSPPPIKRTIIDEKSNPVYKMIPKTPHGPPHTITKNRPPLPPHHLKKKTYEENLANYEKYLVSRNGGVDEKCIIH